MEAINCLFCHHNKGDAALQENGYTGIRCHTCRLIYISPRPTQDEIVNLYGHDNAQLPAHAHIEHGFAKKLHANHTLDIIVNYKKGGQLLEIGAGAGYFLAQAQKREFIPHGLELNPKQADFIRTTLQIPCLQEPLQPTSFGSKRFDVIYHCDVISHLYNPIDEFKIMHTMLADDGIIVFETGNLADVDAAYLPLIPSFQYPDHLFFFGEQHLARLLAMTGFELITLLNYSIVPQLKLINFVQKLKTSDEYVSTSATTASAQPLSARAKFNTILKNGYHYGMHAIRYQLGAYLPKKQRPQTVIVVARKKA